MLSINTRVLDRPLVVEEERLNFEEEEEILKKAVSEAIGKKDPEVADLKENSNE